MRFDSPLTEAVLVRRYKRFLADVVLEDGGEVTAHCANPGSMMGVCEPGSRVYVSRSDNPARKLQYTLEAIRVNRRWVGVHPARANAVVEEALRRGRIPELAGYRSLRREPRYRGEKGRCDFLLEGDPPTWVEVKYVTLAREERALFPDSVSVRATRHVETLSALHRAGERAVVLFVSPRSDVDTVAPADDIDPEFGRALRRAARGGVRVLAYRMAVSRRHLTLRERLDLDLTAPRRALRGVAQP